MSIERVQGVYINCRDLERSVAFYQNLGYRVGKEITTPGNWPVLKVLDLPPDAQARIAIMVLTGAGRNAPTLNLVQWLVPATHGSATHRPPDSDMAAVGMARLSLRTNDLRADYERLRSLGVRFISEPSALPDDEGIDSGLVVCALDPDDTIAQLIELF